MSLIMMEASRVALLILAGGNSSRFGEEKAFFRINGSTLIEHVVRGAGRFHDGLFICCREGERMLRRMFPNAAVIIDTHEVRGAMAGLHSALPLLTADYVMVLPCDCPAIRPEVVAMLIAKGEGHDAAIPVWPNGYWEPLTAFYHKEEMERAVEAAWEGGSMKLSSIIDMLQDVVFVPTEEIRRVDPKLGSFINLNSPGDIDLLPPGWARASPSRSRRTR